MSRRILNFPALVILALTLAVPSLAFAKKKKAEPEKEPAAEEVSLEDDSSKKDKDNEEEKSDAEKSSDGEEKSDSEEGEKKDEASSADQPASATEGNADTSPVEEKGKSYYFVGLRARALVVPTFIIEAFGDGGKTVLGPMIGPEFGIRRDNFEYDFAISYTAYPMDRTPFKAPTDPDTAMELVESHIKVLYFTADFLWSHQFSPEVGLLYGGSAGLGFVWGPLYRAQAYPTGNGGWEMCTGPGQPANPPVYCDPDPQHGDKQHYGDYQEPSWADGGDKPLIMPWLALQMGLRIKPHRNFVGRLDFGFGIGQVFFGLGADYGL